MPRSIARSARLDGFLRLSLAAATLAAIACNPFADARLTDMTPGGNVGTGELECWLGIEFEQLPEGVDPTDVTVRFESVALHEPAEFDWSYIAQHDRIPNGGEFGAGYRDFAASSPGEAPPLGTEFRVKFPLRAKRQIEDAPDPLYLHASLYWGGKKQASLKRTIEHVYRREGMPL